MRALCAELRKASAESAAKGEEEEECELTRVFGSLFGVISASVRKTLFFVAAKAVFVAPFPSLETTEHLS